ncbi:MAG: hypothetical protein V1740_02000 [Candidatus Woesearchaeota archaeon]
MILISLIAYAAPEVPTLISYQGKLANNTDGSPFTTASIRINLTNRSNFDQVVWSSTFNNAVDSQGVFKLVLGRSSQLNLTPGFDYNLIAMVDLNSATFSTSDIVFGNNVPAGDEIVVNSGGPSDASELVLTDNTTTVQSSLDNKLNNTGNTSLNGNLTIFGNLNLSGNLTINTNMTLPLFPSCNLETDTNGRLICGTDDTGASTNSDATQNITFNTNATRQLNFTILTLNTTLITNLATLNVTYGTHIATLNASLTTLNLTTTNQITTLNASVEGLNRSLEGIDYQGLQANITTLNTSLAGLSGKVNSTAWNLTGTNVILAELGFLVGIGTANPGNTLDVQGNTTINGTLHLTGNLTLINFTTCTLKTDDSGQLTCGTDDTSGATNSDVTANITDIRLNISDLKVHSTLATSNITDIRNNLTIRQNADTDLNTTLRARDTQMNSSINTLNNSILTLNESLQWNLTGGNIVLRETSRNVGIGTTTPDSKLHILGNIISNGSINLTGNFTFVNFTSCNLETDGSGQLTCGTDDGGGTEADVTLNITNMTINIATLNASLTTLNLTTTSQISTLNASVNELKDSTTNLNTTLRASDTQMNSSINTLNKSVLTLNSSILWNATGTAMYPRDLSRYIGINTKTPSTPFEINGNLSFSASGESSGKTRYIQILNANNGDYGDHLYIIGGEGGGGGNPEDGGDIYIQAGMSKMDADPGDIFIYPGYDEDTPTLGVIVLAHTGSAPRGMVGIGTNAPSQTLTVQGNVSISHNLTLATLKTCNLETDASGIVYCGTDAGAVTNSDVTANITDIRLNISDLKVFSISATANITDIRNNLTIRQNADTDLNTTLRARDAQMNSSMNTLNNSILTLNESLQWNLTGGFVVLRDTGRNVGIGSTSPGSSLVVNGTINLTGNFTLVNFTSCNLETDGSGQLTCGTDDTGAGGSSPGWTTTSNYLYNDTPAVNVGLNTSTPAYKLQIDASTKALNVSNILFVNSTNVGIGTSTPTKQLEIGRGTGDVEILINQGGTSSDDAFITSDYFQMEDDANLADVYIRNKLNGLGDGYGHLYFQTQNSNTRMTIIQSGNIGIATTSPQTPLHINSTTEQLRLTNTTVNATLAVNAAGDLEIKSHSGDVIIRLG